MGRLEHRVALGVDGAALVRGGLAPQEEHEPGAPLVELRDDGIRELLPTALLVGVGLGLPHREAGVEHEHALLRPLAQAAVGGALEGDLGVLLELLVHVEEGRGRGDAALDAEGEAVGLARAVVGVLPNDDDGHGIEGAEVEGREDFVDWGKDWFRARPFRAGTV